MKIFDIGEKPLFSGQNTILRPLCDSNHTPVTIVKWSPFWVSVSKSAISDICIKPDFLRKLYFWVCPKRYFYTVYTKLALPSNQQKRGGRPHGQTKLTDRKRGKLHFKCMICKVAVEHRVLNMYVKFDDTQEMEIFTQKKSCCFFTFLHGLGAYDAKMKKKKNA